MKKIFRHTEVDEKHAVVFEKTSRKSITGIVEQYNNKGYLVRRSEYRDGVRHGIHEGYNNGIMYHNSFWKNGEPDGDWKNYSSHILKEHIFFKNGKRQFAKYYSRTGYLLREEKYTDGLPDGYFEQYSGVRNSFVWAGNFKKGIRTGIWKLYKYRPTGHPVYITMHRGKNTLHMGYKNIAYGKSKSIEVGNSKNGKPYGWWFRFSVKKIAEHLNIGLNNLEIDLERFWDNWKLKPEDELPENFKKILNKKEYFELTD